MKTILTILFLLSLPPKPTANAGLDKSVILPVSSVMIIGKGWSHDGCIKAYLWTKISGPSGSVISVSNDTLLLTGLKKGVYNYQLKITDGDGQIATDNVIVNVASAAVAVTIKSILITYSDGSTQLIQNK